jgi:hypothetical protein
MKKLFKYIEHLWLGDDGKPSGKRLSALVLTGHLIYCISDNLTSYVHLIKAVYLHDQNITPEMVTSAGASLGSLALVLGIEATLILALWGIAGYQTVQFGKSNPPQQNYYSDINTKIDNAPDDYSGVAKIG